MVDGSHEDAVEEMWDEYDAIHDEVEELLSDWQKSLVRGNPAEVRDEVRSFSHRQEQAFRVLVLCFQDHEQFWADAEVTLDEEAVEHLQEVGEKYRPQLGALFHTVYMEATYGHKNTITDTSTDIELTNRGADPVIRFEALSGRVPIFELHESPAHFIDLAETHVSSVNSALDLVDQFEENDIKHLKSQLDRLEKKTNEVIETMNNIEGEDGEDNEITPSTEETRDEDYT